MPEKALNPIQMRQRRAARAMFHEEPGERQAMAKVWYNGEIMDYGVCVECGLCIFRIEEYFRIEMLNDLGSDNRYGGQGVFARQIMSGGRFYWSSRGNWRDHSWAKVG